MRSSSATAPGLPKMLCAATCVLFAQAAASGGSDTEVAVEGGRICGDIARAEDAEVRVFRGVPFAAPPVGPLRWRPPQPVVAWEGVRACTDFAPACPQPADMTYGFAYANQSEDCLYLNIWTAANASERRPVMVWIHGGGNTIGGAYAPVYDGRHFAAAGVVLVSIQYRLGAFGYLAHPALTDEARRRDGRAASGNYGLMDQLAALRWVRDHIAGFGGDAGCVTIFGESAGAANVTHLMASPLTEGLFHRAIAQSGYFGENTPQLSPGGGPLSRSGHTTGLEFAARLGVPGEDAAALEALRGLPAEKLLSVPVSVGSIVAGGGSRTSALRFGPIVDGYVLPRAPADVWRAGAMHRVPLIAGSLLDDGSVFSRANPVRRLAGYRLAMRTIFGPDAEAALQVFAAATDEEVPAAVHRLITCLSFRAPARRLVRWMEAAGGDAWLYHFSRNPGKGRSRQDGVFHGLEIPYVFHSFTAFGGDTDRSLSREMLARWVDFARDGDPNGRGDEARRREPVWPKYRAAEDQLLDFGDRLLIASGLDRAACDLLDAAASRR